MTFILYGIKSCDTVRKARLWLEAGSVPYEFVDYRFKGLDPNVLDGWFRRAGWEKVLNRSSAAFRALPDADKEAIDEAKARRLILANTNLVKRPVLDGGGTLLFGFRPAEYEAAVRVG
jgi:arsenate reductase